MKKDHNYEILTITTIIGGYEGPYNFYLSTNIGLVKVTPKFRTNLAKARACY